MYRSSACAGERGGARVGKPRCARIVAITVGCLIAAIIVISPPQWGQRSMSIANTRFSSRAQLMRTGDERVLVNIHGKRGNSSKYPTGSFDSLPLTIDCLTVGNWPFVMLPSPRNRQILRRLCCRKLPVRIAEDDEPLPTQNCPSSTYNDS